MSQSHFATLNSRHLVPIIFQQQLDAVANKRLIVHNQNLKIVITRTFF